jgi:hypothetical protein
LQSINAYAYVVNNPLNLVDPEGLTAYPKCTPSEPFNCAGGDGFGGGDGGWGGGDGGFGSGTVCVVDNVETPCGLLSSLLNSGNAAVCPHNDCTGLKLVAGPGGNNIWQQLVPDLGESVTVGGLVQSSTLYLRWVTLGAASGSSFSLLAASDAATISTAPATPWYKNSCITSALGNAALHVGIDAIGLIPEAGGIARVIGHQAGYVGVVADHAGFKVVDAFGKSTGAVSGLAGLGDTSPEGLVSTGLTAAGFIPGAGQIAAGLSVGWDIFRAVKEIRHCR